MSDIVDLRDEDAKDTSQPCIWCGLERDHKCGMQACGNCCASLGNCCHESDETYHWLKEVALPYLKHNKADYERCKAALGKIAEQVDWDSNTTGIIGFAREALADTER
jgi:hypothetical protein